MSVVFNNNGAVRTCSRACWHSMKGGAHSRQLRHRRRHGAGPERHAQLQRRHRDPRRARCGVQGGVVNFNTNYAIAGTTDMQAGTLNVGNNVASTGSLLQSSGQRSPGSNVLTIANSGTITFGGPFGHRHDALDRHPRAIDSTGAAPLDGGARPAQRGHGEPGRQPRHEQPRARHCRGRQRHRVCEQRGVPSGTRGCGRATNFVFGSNQGCRRHPARAPSSPTPAR